MPSIEDFREGTHNGKEGFFLTYEYNGLRKKPVKARATGRLASSFPIKANEIEVTDISLKELDEERGVNTYVLDVFIPKKSSIEELTTEKLMAIIEQLT